MDAVTYPDAKVIDFVNTNLVAIRVKSDSKPLADDFNIKWTPTFIVLDPSGKEHNRTVGFMPPEEFIPSLLLGIAKTWFDADQFPESIQFLDRLLSEYPKSGSAPEAVFLRGVTGFKTAHDGSMLKAASERLEKEYPGSEWAKRAAPYQLL
jgi:hypothetical protein